MLRSCDERASSRHPANAPRLLRNTRDDDRPPMSDVTASAQHASLPVKRHDLRHERDPLHRTTAGTSTVVRGAEQGHAQCARLCEKQIARECSHDRPSTDARTSSGAARLTPVPSCCSSRKHKALSCSSSSRISRPTQASVRKDASSARRPRTIQPTTAPDAANRSGWLAPRGRSPWPRRHIHIRPRISTGRGNPCETTARAGHARRQCRGDRASPLTPSRTEVRRRAIALPRTTIAHPMSPEDS